MEIIVIETAGVPFSQLEKYLGCVGKARQASVMKKAQDEMKVQSLVAGLLVRYELSHRTGIPAKKITFEKGPHGKPYVTGGGVQFSLSHTNGAVCAAFSEGDDDIGVDIELRSRKVSDSIRGRVLSERERSLASTGEDFVRIWVKKEAFLKRTGIGIATALCGADTTLLPDLQVFEVGEYFIGAAGKSCAEAVVTRKPLSELLSGLDT